MVWGFGSSSSSPSSSSSSTSSSPSSSSEPPAAPTREQRAACWSTRDAYFECLTSHQVHKPGEESKGPDGKEISGGGPICKTERGEYERNCSKSWIDYFNKRRTLEARQRATVDAAARQTAQAANKR